MTRRRRATDRPPLSEVVSRGNLDDRLDIIRAKLQGTDQVAVERWRGHKSQHRELASNLREYKAQANEWRATLTDLRANFELKAEASAESKRLEALISGMDARLDLVERAIQSINDREVTTRSVLSSGRSIIVLGFIVLGGLVGLGLYLRPIP